MYSVCADCEYTLIRFSFLFFQSLACVLLLPAFFFFSLVSNVCFLRIIFPMYSALNFLLFSSFVSMLSFPLCFCRFYLHCVYCVLYVVSVFSCSAGTASHLALLLLLSFGILFISLVYRCFVRSDSISFLIDMCMILRFPKFTLYITSTIPHSTTVLLRIGFAGVFFPLRSVLHTQTQKKT